VLYGKEVSVTILLLSFLHKQGTINDARLKAMFKSLKEGTLLRHINTYHCPINNSWYNGENIFNILLEAYLERAVPQANREMSVEVFLSYLQKYYNANKNYCVDVLTSDFILPLLEKSISDTRVEDVLKDWGVITKGFNYENYEDSWRLSDGYCCSDCDGCLGEYKRSRWRNHIEDEYKSFVQSLAKTMKTYKKHDKNPHDYLDSLKSEIVFNDWY
jgi:hypothetical protein